MQVDPAPCGACGTLVSYDEGCRHWKPAGRRPNTTGRKPLPKPRRVDAAERAALREQQVADLVRALGYPKP